LEKKSIEKSSNIIADTNFLKSNIPLIKKHKIIRKYKLNKSEIKKIKSNKLKTSEKNKEKIKDFSK